ncbi:HWE histidine kinase domain-containing protein [Yoonia sp. SS1-5]|uniref:histidine kinase n=1 Tax=Yoonia rhodophyticola TaxID=3137370 RepID=A0AAN0MM82_9RHOB
MISKYDNRFANISRIEDPLERRRAVALQAAQIGVFEYEPETDIAFWDSRVRELWGIPAGEVITYDKVVRQVHPDDLELHDDATARALDPTGDGRLDITYRLFPRKGPRMRWIHAVGYCFFDGDRPVRLVGTVQDVTAQKRADDKNKMLVYELEHRVKNTLATAIAVLSLSRGAHADVDQYFNAVHERLRSLASSHDLLRKSQWTAVDFADLLNREADGFIGQQSNRLLLKGAPIAIPPGHVMTLSMAIHELMTNSAKFGALASDDGTIEVTTFVTGKTRKIVWKETECAKPPDTAETRTGLGSVLIQNIMPTELGGTVSRRFEGRTMILEIAFSTKKARQT